MSDADENVLPPSIRPRGIDSAEVVQTIKTTAVFGAGIDSDPVRVVTEYWTLDGNRIARVDPSSQSEEPPL
jgi:hypothetical protein